MRYTPPALGAPGGCTRNDSQYYGAGAGYPPARHTTAAPLCAAARGAGLVAAACLVAWGYHKKERASGRTLSLFYGRWLFIVANSGVRYGRYHYRGVSRVVGVLSIVVVAAEIEILEVALNFVVAALVGPTPAVVGVGMATSWRKLPQMPGLHELYDHCECDA